MRERLDPYRKSPAEVSELIKNLGRPIVNPVTGDKVWSSKFVESDPFGRQADAQYILAMSPEGGKIFRNVESFLSKMESGKLEPTSIRFDRITGLRGIVKKTKIYGLFSPNVYVKTIKPVAEPYVDVSGVEQFAAMRLLQISGVKVADPLLATRYRIVTREVIGIPIYDKRDPKFCTYIKQLNDIRENLISKGLWNRELRIDENPSNYLLAYNGIVAIDPVYRHSFILFG